MAEIKDKLVTAESLKKAYDTLNNKSYEKLDVVYDETKNMLILQNTPELQGNVYVDKTLTESGNAADAKATGDAIAGLKEENTELKSDLDKGNYTIIPQMEYGLYYASTGEKTEDNFGYRLSGLRTEHLQLKKGDVITWTSPINDINIKLHVFSYPNGIYSERTEILNQPYEVKEGGEYALSLLFNPEDYTFPSVENYITITRSYLIDNIYETIEKIQQEQKDTTTYIVLNFDAVEKDSAFMTYRKSLLDAYGFKGVGCLNNIVLLNNGASWRSTEDEIQYKQMLKEGWDFALYTSTSSSAYDADGWTSYLKTWVDNLESLGVYNIVGYHCTGNNLNDDLLQGVTNNNFRICRCENTSYAPYLLPIAQTEDICIPVSTYHIDCGVGATTIKSYIDNAISKGGGVLSIMAHLVIDTDETIDSWNVYTSRYNDMLSYIKEKVDESSVKVVTWRELYNMFNPKGGYENDYNRCMKTALHN